MADVLVVDYGMGNLFSVSQALKKCGANVTISSEPEEIVSAERVLLPGVGAFGMAMQELGQRELISPLKQFAASGNPLLGICLGMQLLFEESDEFGSTSGLSIVPGNVCYIAEGKSPTAKLKVPHIGWSAIKHTDEGMSWDGTVLMNSKADDTFYFVHSYVVHPKSPQDKLAISVYGEHRFNSVIRHENVFGCQFHPEKSGENGLKLLEAFCNLSG